MRPRAPAPIVTTTAQPAASFNLFMIAGLDDRDQIVGTIKVFPNIESIGEAKIQVGNSDAEYATGGAVVNVITRSGGEPVPRVGFRVLSQPRSPMPAASSTESSRPFQMNQFGGAIGEPIRKNKTFFFGDYQGERIHSSTTRNPEPGRYAAIRAVATSLATRPSFTIRPHTTQRPTRARRFPGTCSPPAGSIRWDKKSSRSSLSRIFPAWSTISGSTLRRCRPRTSMTGASITASRKGTACSPVTTWGGADVTYPH